MYNRSLKSSLIMETRKPRYNPDGTFVTLDTIPLGVVCEVFPDNQLETVPFGLRGPVRVIPLEVKSKNGQTYVEVEIPVSQKRSTLSGMMAAKKELF